MLARPEGHHADRTPARTRRRGPGQDRRSGRPCYFCEVIAGRSEKAIVEETDLTLTLVNWMQFELGQVYVIPRRHAPTLFDLTDEEAVAVFHTVRRIADALCGRTTRTGST